MNTSATGGYLTPDNFLVPDDIDLDIIFQGLVKSITGLDGQYVRPRWQPKPPKQPLPEVNWCAVGVLTVNSDYSLTMPHDKLSAYELLEVSTTFYGPASRGYAQLLRDGVQIPQNNEAIRKHGIVYHSFSPIRPCPEYVNEQWIRRHDLMIYFKRKEIRKYPILDFAESSVKFIGD